MVRAIIDEEFDYVLECDRELPEDEQTVFRLRVLTVSERARLMDGAGAVEVSSQTFRPSAGTTQLDTVRAGLIGWRNLTSPTPNEEGFHEEVPFEKGKTLNILGRNCAPPSDKCLNFIRNHLLELANAIEQGSQITVEDAEG